jgi:antitoxin (DNA-binding transcriptional repressor) of toxin-antitoxin stability system
MVTTAKKLRFDTKAVLSSISRGEEVLITYRGKAYAKLIPVNEKQNKINKTGSIFGIWKDFEEVKDPGKYIRHLRKRRKNATD